MSTLALIYARCCFKTTDASGVSTADYGLLASVLSFPEVLPSSLASPAGDQVHRSWLSLQLIRFICTIITILSNLHSL